MLDPPCNTWGKCVCFEVFWGTTIIIFHVSTRMGRIHPKLAILRKGKRNQGIEDNFGMKRTFGDRYSPIQSSNTVPVPTHVSLGWYLTLGGRESRKVNRGSWGILTISNHPDQQLCHGQNMSSIFPIFGNVHQSLSGLYIYLERPNQEKSRVALNTSGIP